MSARSSLFVIIIIVCAPRMNVVMYGVLSSASGLERGGKKLKTFFFLLSYLLGKVTSSKKKKKKNMLHTSRSPNVAALKMELLSRFLFGESPRSCCLFFAFDDRLISSLITYIGALCIIRRDLNLPPPKAHTRLRSTAQTHPVRIPAPGRQ